MFLPGDSPDLCYEVFVTDAREVPDFICGHTIGAAIGRPSSPTFADRLLCRIRFTLHNQSEKPLTTHLKQATRTLVLLLDNAQKFTRPAEATVQTSGGITGKEDVTLSIQEQTNPDDKSDIVAFIIEDTGIGIPPEEAEHIFEEFVQLDEYYDGTGIGLTVARSIARRLGGDIRLDTTYTQGARFIFTLPL